MVETGRTNRLQVRRLTPQGAYLGAGVEEILLPARFVPEGLAVGDELEVFVYLDSEDRPVATTQMPLAQLGDYALLQVRDTGRVGAFLDWGLDKDLLVPFSEQQVPMKKGELHVVTVYLDRSGRLAASARIEKFLDKGPAPLKRGEEVDLMVFAMTALGAKVIINGRYGGLLFKEEVHAKLSLGARLKGFVKKVREDHKIDVSLHRGGHAGMESSKERILKTLAATGGFLPLSDGSSPEVIAEVLHMSKKSFKKAIGNLYKEGYIQLNEDGIRLRQK